MEIRFTPEMLETHIRIVEEKLREVEEGSREHAELAEALNALYAAREALHVPSWEMLD